MFENDVYKVDITMEGSLPFFHVQTKKELSLQDVKDGRQIFSWVKGQLKDKGYDRLYAASYTMNFARLVGPGYHTIEKYSDEGFELIVWETGE